ncbi:MAG: hypothetical protein Q4P32_08455 [Micrococcales bacterium]|nr:hypothetical protein [Micrococcales bacterium]
MSGGNHEMFTRYEEFEVDLGDVRIAGRCSFFEEDAGEGANAPTRPPLLLLHGHPQTHLMRHRIADDVTGQALDCGHYLPEEAPEQVLEQIREFLLQG